MSTHNGVSCDSCMRTNFPGRRYKCLLCDNYDLCGVCYDVDAESQNHKNDHPMQCILTDAAYEIFYAGEKIPRRTAVSLTCSHCGLAGFIPRTLLMHCVEKHSSTSMSNKNNQVVMCPICVTSPTHRSRSRFLLLAEHIAMAHDEESGGASEDWIASSIVNPIRRERNEEEDSDEEEEEDEEPSLNDLEHRAFIEEEHRRQETARQRLAHNTSLAAAIRNDYAAALNGSTNSQRRPFIRQTAIRGARGSLRGHFTNYPYGAASRLATGFASNAALRNASDTSTGNLTPNSSLTDSYTAFAIAQDPMLGFVSRLVNNQQGSATTTSNNSLNNPFFFGLTTTGQTPTPLSTTTTSSELARLQQQIENNESMSQIKSTLLNNKQKRTSQNQQSTEQPVILMHPWGLDYSPLQQQFPNTQTLPNQSNVLTGAVLNDLIIGNNSVTNSSLKNSQQSYREHDPRSLLGKILRDDNNVNTDSKNERHKTQEQDHMSYLQSILLSTILTTSDDEQQQQQQENQNKQY